MSILMTFVARCFFPFSSPNPYAFFIFHIVCSALRTSAINKVIMAEASLAFPAICLTLSFLFVVAVYNASIMQHLGACHRRIILPVYQFIARNLFNRNHVNQDQDRIPLAEYEPINPDPNDEDEQHPHLATPARNHHRPGENNVLDTANRIAESDDDIGSGSPNLRDSNRPQHPNFADRAQFSTVSPPPGSVDDYGSEEYDSDEYGSDWSDSDDEHYPVDDIPIWEFQVERPYFNVEHPEQGGPVVWLDEVVEWTSQGIFAYVTPELDE